MPARKSPKSSGQGSRRSGEGGVRFISPFALGAKGDWMFAASLSDIPEGGSARDRARRREGVCCRARAPSSTCFQNACAHMGLTLDDGEVEDGIITCPHHEFQYDLSSGECLTAPEVQLQSHAVRVVGRRVEVRLSK